MNPTAAQALKVTVIVDGQDYSLTTTSAITFAGNEALLQSQPWWENTDLANDLSNALASQLGTPNILGVSPSALFFAWTKNTQLVFGKSYLPSQNIVGFKGVPFGTPAVFAIQSPPSAVPGPLPLFGTAAAFGLSRRLRRRIRLAY